MRDISKQLPYPIHLDIESTNYCMLNCPMCPRKFMSREKGFMDWRTLQKIVGESKGKTKTVYLHHMGDPLLHRDLPDMIQYIKAAGMWVAISTNAILLTEQISRELFKAGLDYLFLSFDSLEKDVYEKYREGASFYQVLANVEHCIKALRSRDYKTKLELQLIAMKDNVAEIEKYKKCFEPKLKNVGKVAIKPYDYWTGHVPDFSLENSVPEKFICTMFNYSMTIEWNGDVTVCCHDYDNFTKMGNIHEKSIREIWDSTKYMELRKAHKARDFYKMGFCKGCYLASQKKLDNYADIYKRLSEKNFRPRLNFKTIKFLEKILMPETDVLETGSGASTIWFANRVKHVTSFEDLSSWYYVLMDIIEEKKLRNIAVHFKPGYSKKELLAFKRQFDVVLLDGTGGATSRISAMKTGYKNVKPGGYLIVDDAHRYEEYKAGIDFLNDLGWVRFQFDGLDPYREEKSAIIYLRPKGKK